jgi:hypothetical protein
LGGFSKLNMFEKLEGFFEDHYVINNSNFENILKYEKYLSKLDEIEIKNNLNSSLEKIFLTVANQFTFTKDVSSKVESILLAKYGELPEIIEDPFDDYFEHNKLKKKYRIDPK